MWRGISFVRKGLITAQEFVDAADRQLKSRVPIGRLALEQKMLTMHQALEILTLQADDPKPFGQLAVEAGYISKKELAELLMLQNDRMLEFDEILVEMGVVEGAIATRVLSEAQSDAASDMMLCRVD